MPQHHRTRADRLATPRSSHVRSARAPRVGPRSTRTSIPGSTRTRRDHRQCTSALLNRAQEPELRSDQSDGCDPAQTAPHDCRDRASQNADRLPSRTPQSRRSCRCRKCWSTTSTTTTSTDPTAHSTKPPGRHQRRHDRPQPTDPATRPLWTHQRIPPRRLTYPDTSHDGTGSTRPHAAHATVPTRPIPPPFNPLTGQRNTGDGFPAPTPTTARPIAGTWTRASSPPRTALRQRTMAVSRASLPRWGRRG